MSTSVLPAAEEADDDDPEGPGAAAGLSKPRWLRVLGPGLITGASDHDLSGIATTAPAAMPQKAWTRRLRTSRPSSARFRAAVTAPGRA